MSITILPMNHTKVEVEAHFPDSSPAELYEWWMQPDLITQWWVGKVTQLDARDGGAYQFDWEAQNWTLRGVFSDVVQNKQFNFTWHWDHQPEMPERTVRIRLVRQDSGGTMMQIEHGTYDDSERDQEDRQSHIDGWKFFLSQLQKVIDES